MKGKNILALIGAIVVGAIAIKVAFAVLNLAWHLATGLIYLAIGAAIVLGLYRWFNHLLSSGKRLT